MINILSNKLDREEFVNQITHFPGIILGFIFLVALIYKSFLYSEPLINTVSYIIYSFGFMLVYGASTVYHSQVCEKKKAFYKKVDHASIYIFMAGCYTPFVLINMQEDVKYPFFALVWAMAIFGVLYKIYSKYKNRVHSTILYFVFGYMCYLAKDSLLDQLPLESYKLLVYGGLLYSAGAIFYMLKMIPYHHGIWHVFVIAGSTLHFFSVYLTY